jgi:hypothetical protein
VSGANILDMSKIGIDQAVRVNNATSATEAYGRIHAQMILSPGIQVDGIKPDGSFGQHTGLLYNGNYGSAHMPFMVGWTLMLHTDGFFRMMC